MKFQNFSMKDLYIDFKMQCILNESGYQHVTTMLFLENNVMTNVSSNVDLKLMRYLLL